MHLPLFLTKSRCSRWRLLRRIAGLTQKQVIGYLVLFGCKVGKNLLTRLETDSNCSVDQEVISCLSYIYNAEGNPVNLGWVINGIDTPWK